MNQPGGVRRVGPATALVLAALTLAACSGDDAGDASSTPGVPDVTAAPEPASPSATTAPTTTTTEPAGPMLSEELRAVEVSARILGDGAAPDLAFAIAADDSLDDVVVTDQIAQVPVWCSTAFTDVAGGDEGFVVRIAPPAVDRADGGVERFELVSPSLEPAHLGIVATSGPVAATIEFEVDGESVASVAGELALGDGGSFGSFRGDLPDGSVVEGAFRCD